MSSVQIREPESFGKRTEPHKIVVTQNGNSRTFHINPMFFSIGLCFAFMVMIGYLSATAYLVFRDDLMDASFARQARIQHEYEDRIASLRAKLDRVTSRQLLDQQQIESRVSELMARQESIGRRSGRLGDVLQKAKARGLGATKSTGLIPVPSINPQKARNGKDAIITGSVKPEVKNNAVRLSSAFSLRSTNDVASEQRMESNLVKSPVLMAFTAPKVEQKKPSQVFGEIAKAIEVINVKQRNEMDAIRINTAQRTLKIAKILKSVGSSIKTKSAKNTGGPFEPLDHSVGFNVHVNALEDTLASYDRVVGVAKALPLSNPVPGAKISSRFGSRVDPFNGRRAMHSGLDFKAARGTPVKAAGAGTIVRASRKGGYGKVVEIKHINGLVTRYAHLSRIHVKVGQKVTSGQTVGKVGSTGRSTGPHLHYEVRRNGSARNPATYIKTGYKLRGLL